MDRRIVIVNVLIHGFAVAHAITAAALAQTVVGDEAALTALTITMIIGISRVYNRPVGVGEALSVLGIFAGFYLGTRGAVFLVKWIPGIGNAANAITTTVVTEIIGWAAFIVLKEGKDPKNMTEQEKKDVWKRAKAMKEEMKGEQEKIKEALKKMTENDKRKYDKLMERLKDKELSEEESSKIINQLDELMKKYNV